MIKLILIVLFAIVTPGHLQEISSSSYPLSVGNDNDGRQIWSFQGQPRKSKPCAKRRSNKDAEEQWIPSYSSRISYDNNVVLPPQALKNEEYAKNDQRSSSGYISHKFDTSIIPNDDDCVDVHDSVNQLPLSRAEHTAYDIIKDCLQRKLDKKQEKRIQDIPFGASRRSMSGSDDPDNLENSYDISRDSAPQSNFENTNVDTLLSNKLSHPEIGTGIAEIAEINANDKLSNNLRVCYACTTATNPSCWEPDKKTTVKYCSREKSCITKTFGVKGSQTVIRDCANSCQASPVPGIEPKYKTCDVCHTDLCNAASSISGFSLALIFIITIVKFCF